LHGQTTMRRCGGKCHAATPRSHWGCRGARSLPHRGGVHCTGVPSRLWRLSHWHLMVMHRPHKSDGARVQPANPSYRYLPRVLLAMRTVPPVERLPFAKSLRGQNRSSTLRMNSWFHSDRPAITVILSCLILSPTTTIE
jgi:hypothetical protein